MKTNLVVLLAILLLLPNTIAIKRDDPLLDVWRSVEYLTGDSPSLASAEANNYTKTQWVT
jgi:hypothetical protein